MNPPTQPAAPTPPAPQQYTENPGQTLGIIGIVLNALGISIGGIILGVMSRNRSKEAGMATTLGTVSLVWGIVSTVLFTLGFLLLILFSILAANSVSLDNYSSDSYESDSSGSSSIESTLE